MFEFYAVPLTITLKTLIYIPEIQSEAQKILFLLFFNLLYLLLDSFSVESTTMGVRGKTMLP